MPPDIGADEYAALGEGDSDVTGSDALKSIPTARLLPGFRLIISGWNRSCGWNRPNQSLELSFRRTSLGNQSDRQFLARLALPSLGRGGLEHEYGCHGHQRMDCVRDFG